MRTYLILFLFFGFSSCSIPYVRYSTQYGNPSTVKQKGHLLVDEVFELPNSIIDRMIKITEHYHNKNGARVFYMPSVEYDLLAKGVLKEDLQQWEVTDKTRLAIHKTLEVRYLLRADIIEFSPNVPAAATIKFVVHDLLHPNLDYSFEVYAAEMNFPLFGNPHIIEGGKNTFIPDNAYSPIVLAYRRGIKHISKSF